MDTKEVDASKQNMELNCMVIKDVAEAEVAEKETPVVKRKKKKKKKKKKGKKTKSIICRHSLQKAEVGINDTAKPKGTEDGNDSKPKSSSSRCVTFGAINFREYARTLGMHVVPANGGWPLGLSRELITEHPSLDNSRSDSALGPDSWTIDEFESRKQIELQQRYTELIKAQRRRKYEKEWEKRQQIQGFAKHHNTRNQNRRRSNSVGHGGGRDNKSGSFSQQVEMSPEEKGELEMIVSRPVEMPIGRLETRPYDYKKKLLTDSHASALKTDGSVSAKQQRNVTEEEELYHNYGGQNPIFMVTKEEVRRKVLLRDDHLLAKQHHCKAANNNKKDTTNTAKCTFLDPTDSTVMQHIQHDLETLRVSRSCNLGCSCRKLNVFLPTSLAAKDKPSCHKKKSSHRRLPERKVREELRRRGLLHKGNGDMSREKMEILLHDTVEREPCCWGNDCPCVRDGIECQADTCSCWHSSHHVAGSSSSNNIFLPSSDQPCNKYAGGGQSVEAIKALCGNQNGMYVVDLEGIANYRERYVSHKK